jgi:hypothetical protein
VFEERYRALLAEFNDEQVRDLIQANTNNDPDAREDLYNLLDQRYSSLVEEQSKAQASALSSMTELNLAFQFDGKWSILARITELSAELLWLGVFSEYKDKTQARDDMHYREHGHDSPSAEVLRQVVVKSGQLVWLSLEASLNRMRSLSNRMARQIQRTAAGDRTRKTIATEVRKYLARTRAWDKVLHDLSGTHYFQTGFSDAQRLKVLSKRFGQDSLTDQDIGWVAQARDAETELRFQYRDELRRENLRAGQRLVALGYWLQKVTAGYGTKPWLFVRTGGIAILLFTLLFFLNDLWNPGIATGRYFCATAGFQGDSWQAIVREVVHYAYLAVTNLSSLGSNAQVAAYCGGLSTQILLIFAALTGYFLLGLLASLFFQLLTEKD